MDCEKHHKDCTQRKYPGGDAPARLQTNSARWCGKAEELKGRFTATFSRSQNELYEALLRPRGACRAAPGDAIFAQGVGLGLRLAFEALG